MRRCDPPVARRTAGCWGVRAGAVMASVDASRSPCTAWRARRHTGALRRSGGRRGPGRDGAADRHEPPHPSAFGQRAEPLFHPRWRGVQRNSRAGHDRGTLRTHDEAIRAKIKRLCGESARALPALRTCASKSCSMATTRLRSMIPPGRQSPHRHPDLFVPRRSRSTRRVRRRRFQLRPAARPGCIVLLGAANEAKGASHPLHSSGSGSTKTCSGREHAPRPHGARPSSLSPWPPGCLVPGR